MDKNITPIEELEEIKKIHYSATKPMSEYDTGLYNGIELSLSILKNSEPKYKDVEKKSV